MNRRDLLMAMTTLTSLPSLPAAAAAPRPLREAARDAWLYALPLIEMAGARSAALQTMAVNRISGATALTTLTTQFVTTPNNDTLYARAWLDLDRGPVTITLPASGERYLSVALMDMYSNNFAVLGTRTTGRDGAVVRLVGPSAAVSPGGGALTVRAPTRWVWLLARTLVDGDADLAAAVAVQSAIRVDGPAAAVPPAQAARGAPWAAYFASAQALLDENPPPATDLAWLQRIAPVLVPGRPFDPGRYDAAQAAEIEAGVADARAVLRSPRRPGPVLDGWVYPKPNLGDFGQDVVYRAQVAVGGLAALPPVEALYMRPLSDKGTFALDSTRGWRLHFPAGRLPPVHAFWSLTMYELTPDGQAFFTPNPIDRYAIGDRTPGLQRGADGALTLWMTRDDPGEARRANWLPTPGNGKPFTMVLRAYLPKDELLINSYRVPALEALAAG